MECVGPENVTEVAQYKSEVMWEKAHLHEHKGAQKNSGGGGETQIIPWFGKSKNHYGSANQSMKGSTAQKGRSKEREPRAEEHKLPSMRNKGPVPVPSKSVAGEPSVSWA